MIQIVGCLLMALISGAMFLVTVSLGTPVPGRKRP
jgi:hypothetical protein